MNEKDEQFEGAEPESLYPGAPLLNWVVDEYERHERGTAWYVIAAVLGFGLLIWSVLTQNFLFAVILVMVGVILGLSSFREPRKVDFVATDLGIGLDGRFYPYKNFRNFWMLYEPPDVKNMYLEFRTSPRPHLVIPLDEQDPVEVRETLLNFMKEDLTKEDEPMSDLMGRILKL